MINTKFVLSKNSLITYLIIEFWKKVSDYTKKHSLNKILLNRPLIKFVVIVNDVIIYRFTFRLKTILYKFLSK